MRALPLLATRRLGPLFATQFLGAFNDNLFKNALVVLLAFNVARDQANLLVNLAAGLFILPFFLFSATSGQIADKYERSGLVRLTKLMEIAVMCLGGAGLVLNSVPLMLAALFLMGSQSTLFGPLKYSVLPQHLPERELLAGNALVEAGTFLAILLGTLGGGLLITVDGGRNWVAAGVLLVAVAGWIASRGIPAAPAPSPDLKVNLNLFTETWRNLKFTHGNRPVFLSILGISWFWFYGALLLTQFPALVRDSLGGGETLATLMLAVFSLGVGLGSMACERLAGGKVEIGLVPLGAAGMTLFAVDLWHAASAYAGPAPAALAFATSAQGARILADLALLAASGGVYAVPLYAMMQSRSDASHRARVIAGNNILNALFMVVAAGTAAGLLSAGLTVPQLILVTALMNAAVAVYIFALVPEFVARFLAWALVHSIYRLRVRGLEHLPEKGAGLVVCNHVSYADALVLAAAAPRPIRFVMDHRIYHMPVLNYVFRASRTIPIASAKEDPALLEAAYAEVAKALAEGELVGIFPEGRLTVDGEIGPFRPGTARILEKTPVPVIPLALSGMWGSILSRAPHRRLRGLFPRLTLAAAVPIPAAEADPGRLREAVLALRVAP